MIGFSNVTLDNKKLSRIAFGTHKFKMCELKHNMHLLDMYVKGGGNVIDTARCYQNGESEQCIGEWIRENRNREKVVLITKGCNPAFCKGILESRLNGTELEKDITESLQALGTEYIDIYFFHKDDQTVEPAHAIEMINKYVKQGIVKHIGASNWSTKRIEEANAYALRHGLKPFEFSEPAFSLKINSTQGWGESEQALEMNKEDYEWYKAKKMPVIGYNSQAYGFFYKQTIEDTESESNRKIFDILKNICADNHINPHQALFAFYFGCGIANIPLVSCASPEHLKGIIDNCNAVLSEEDVQKLLKERFK